MLSLKLISPERIEFMGEVESVLVPGTKGQFEILTDHAPIISSLGAGDIIIGSREGKKSVPVSGGFVQVTRNEVNICVEL